MSMMARRAMAARDVARPGAVFPVRARAWTLLSRAIDQRRETEHDAARHRRFLLDAGDDDGTDFGRIGHMGAAAGLQIDAFDLEHAHPPQAARRLDAHAAHQTGVGIELGFRNPALADRVRLVDQARQARIQRLLVERRSHVEVQARVIGGDRTTVDRLRNQRAQQVRGGMKAHVPLPARHVDLSSDRRSDAQERQQRLLPGGRQVQNLARERTLAGIEDLQLATVRQDQQASVTGLAATQRIENRAIELHAALVDARYAGVTGGKGGVFAKQLFGHRWSCQGKLHPPNLSLRAIKAN
jgi:hypothetical protein